MLFSKTRISCISVLLTGLLVLLSNADTLVEERCFCRKHIRGDSGSILLAKYFDRASNDSAQVEWRCYNNHCVTKGCKSTRTAKLHHLISPRADFFGKTKCSRSKANIFTFCFRADKTSSDKYSIDGTEWVLLDDLGTDEEQVDNCDQLCKTVFEGLPVLNNVWAGTHRWSWRVADRLG